MFSKKKSIKNNFNYNITPEIKFEIAEKQRNCEQKINTADNKFWSSTGYLLAPGVISIVCIIKYGLLESAPLTLLVPIYSFAYPTIRYKTEYFYNKLKLKKSIKENGDLLEFSK